MGEAAPERERIARIAEDYYDNGDADTFYFEVWGGEDIHVGLYDPPGMDPTHDIATASRRTVERMTRQLDPPLGPGARVLDLGAGYGGSARQLARGFGCHVTCLNISQTQNRTNQRLNAEQGLDRLIRVDHGSFESVPEPDGAFDAVWAQDALLHSSDRALVLREAFRCLKPGGQFVFTDPMQADDVPPGVLQPVYDRIHLPDLGSFGCYREAAPQAGFTVQGVTDLSPQLGRHYAAVRRELEGRYHDLLPKVSAAYLDRMLNGLSAWIDASAKGYLTWGIIDLRKPA